ncbi:MAG: hypothetical protein Q7S63_00725 [bacterium]|nr:hypothetical protein [bacterium]
MRYTDERGFTVVELVVVSSLMILITGLLLVNTQSTRGRLALERSLHQVALDVTRAHELALRSQAYTCASGSITGYGLAVDLANPGSYIVFAECNGTNSYEQGSDGIIETVSLSKGVVISQTLPSPEWSIVFLPPDPQVFLKPGNPVQVQLSLIVQQDPSFIRTIVINSRGIADIQ